METRKNIDLLADGSIGDPIKSIIVAGGETPLDSDNDGFTDGSVTAPSIILSNSKAYAFDLTGIGTTGETVTFFEGSNGVIGTPRIIQLLADMFLMTLIHRANNNFSFCI